MESMDSVCRACLGPCPPGCGVELFEGSPSLSTLLRRAARVRPRPTDGGPRRLCPDCDERLAAAMRFRSTCEASDRRIRTFLESAKQCDLPPSPCPASSPSSPIVSAVVKDPVDEEKNDTEIEMDDDKESRRHACLQCGRRFKYKDNLKVHMMTHTGERPYSCDTCKKSFSKKDNLAVHKKRHLKERDHSCEVCGSAYYTNYELKLHMRAHTGEKPHECNVCGKRFTAKSNLYIHQRSHTGEKPHVCPVCGKQFTSKNILSIHSRIHTGEKPYVCSVCGKRFAANKLAVHMRTHTGEKPHVCNLCGKQFSATNVLVIHMRRHTGEKPYECKLCGQRYGHTQSLNKHMRRQHQISKAPRIDEEENVDRPDCVLKSELPNRQIDNVNKLKLEDCFMNEKPTLQQYKISSNMPHLQIPSSIDNSVKIETCIIDADGNLQRTASLQVISEDAQHIQHIETTDGHLELLTSDPLDGNDRKEYLKINVLPIDYDTNDGHI